VKPNESHDFYELERAKLTEVAKPITDYIRDALEAASLEDAAAAEGEGEGEEEGEGEGEGERGEGSQEDKFHDEF